MDTTIPKQRLKWNWHTTMTLIINLKNSVGKQIKRRTIVVGATSHLYNQTVARNNTHKSEGTFNDQA